MGGVAGNGSARADQPLPLDYDADVVIVGSGFAGSLLAIILARHGVRALMLERGSHPRFAIGESTTPEATALLGILAARYDIPEIGHLSCFHGVLRNVSSSCGVKRNFSFAYHRRGESQRRVEATQYPTWAPPFGPDVHLFRQDVDAWLIAIARRYGAELKQRTSVTQVHFDADGVTLGVDDGPPLRARYLVDASGTGSVVAHALELREEPTRLATRSRAVFTHMVDVAPYDECEPCPRKDRLASPLHQGTLHHIFDGGWIWVIPFDNHPDSTNPLCSVGLCIEPSTVDHGDGPADAFRSVVAQLPSVARQFADAKAVRPWTGTPRMQFSSTVMVGDRYCLLPHACGFTDPLFSSGLTFSVAAINFLGERLIETVRDDRFTSQRFRFVEDWYQRNLDHYDRLISCSYVTFRDFGLWNAWHRVWMLGTLYAVCGLHEVFARYRGSDESDRSVRFEEPPYGSLQAIDLPEYAVLFSEAASVVDAFDRGELGGETAARRIYRLLAGSELCPPRWRLTDPARRCPSTFTAWPMIELLAWGRFKSRDTVRRHYFGGGRSSGLLSALARGQLQELRRGAGLRYLRDSLWSWNQDWRFRAARATIWDH